MNRYLAAVSLLALASCGGNLPASDTVACAAALRAANTHEPGALLSVAAGTPSCAKLAENALRDVLVQVAQRKPAP